MDSSDYMTCALKLDTQTQGWHKTLTRLLKGIEGVTYSIDAQQGIAHISGKIDASSLLKLLEKAGKHAQLCWVDSGNHNKNVNVMQFNDKNNYYNYGYDHNDHHQYHNNNLEYPRYMSNNDCGYGYGYGHGQYYPHGASRRDYYLNGPDHLQGSCCSHSDPHPCPIPGVTYYEQSWPQNSPPSQLLAPEDFNIGDPQWCAIM